jgi:hypothetical protein
LTASALFTLVPPRGVGFGRPESIILPAINHFANSHRSTNMQRVRFLFLAGLVLAMSSTLLANPQEAAAKDQGPSQAKQTNNDEGHRKHWWSPPHFHHKKHGSQTAAEPSRQTAQVKPVNHTAAPAHPGITVSEKPENKTAQKKPVKKTIASAHPASRPVHKHAASTGHTSRTASRTVAATTHKKKSVRHNCSAEESKTGGCQAQHSTKPATTRS